MSLFINYFSYVNIHLSPRRFQFHVDYKCDVIKYISIATFIEQENSIHKSLISLISKHDSMITASLT